LRRRPPRGVPSDLVVFDPDDWPAVGKNEAERYRSAVALWDAARDAWAEEHGWEGDEAWWAASHEAIASMPDEPWDESLI
jgi:hypothetical protein